MIITISLSESDLQRISDVLGLTEYNDIHESIVKAYGDMLDAKEGLMDIKINPNSDCAVEIELLKLLLRGNKKYTAAKLSNADIVSMAVNALYGKLIAEKIDGVNQRSI